MSNIDILQLRKKLKLTQEKLGELIGVSKRTIINYEKGEVIPASKSAILLNLYKNSTINTDDRLVTTPSDDENASEKTSLIPFYEDVSSIGGAVGMSTNTIASSTTTYVNAGDWFPEATAACRHYGDSMMEYTSGCILALKELKDLKNGFIWGKNYVVEYGEDWNRVTKTIVKVNEIIMGYSTNKETIAEGVLKHQPLELVPIHRAWKVLGSVTKDTSSTGIIEIMK